MNGKMTKPPSGHVFLRKLKDCQLIKISVEKIDNRSWRRRFLRFGTRFPWQQRE